MFRDYVQVFSQRPKNGVKHHNMVTLFNTIFWCHVGLNSCAKSRAPLCHAADRPVCLASTSVPDMFLGVALVCPAFLCLFEQTGSRNCVLVLSVGNDSDC